MAMERQLMIREVHTRSLTAVGYNPARREILVGCEDGCIKTFEAESGKLTGTFFEHKGWITDFLYWPDQKLMLSSANDGLIIAWSSGGLKVDTISLRSPVYSMTINPRRQQLVCGMNAHICAYDFDPDKQNGHIINSNKPAHVAREHTDIVKVVLCYESRIYSAGYDAKLIIYDSSYTGEKSMTPVHIHKNAHDAGICSLVIARDMDNTWVITGGFDKTVKIWSVDGKLIHRLEGFLNTVTGVCYAPRNKTLWVASGASSAQLFDPRSGDNISDYIGTFSTNLEEEYKFSLQQLKWQPEMNQVIATTSRRQVIAWKYNPFGCITALRNKSPIESISYTRKRPILIFTGDHTGQIVKWEQMQSNNFMYSNEAFVVTELMLKKMTKLRKLTDKEKLDLKNAINQMRDKERQERKAKLSPVKQERKSRYGYQKPSHSVNQKFTHPNQSILVTMFIEELDIILAASEDSNIYVWGFDDSAVAVLQNMKFGSSGASDCSHTSSLDKYAILLKCSASKDAVDPKSTADYLKMMKEEESVSNRVAGFICKYILSEHRGCVTCLCVIHRSDGYDSTYVVSGGWDHRIVVWDIENGSMQTIYKDKGVEDDLTSNDSERRTSEWAADGIITSMQYNPDQNEIAYASSDHMVYIRKFSLDGTNMPLVNTLQHDAEISAVKWNSITKQWVTGSEDGQIKIWSGTGMNDLIVTLAEKHAVTCLCIDAINGSIIAGLQNVIKVFDSEKFRLVQTNVGHTDSVRAIIHIAERNHYVSCSWDKTIRIWNEWKQVKTRAAVHQKGNNETANQRQELPKHTATTKQDIDLYVGDSPQAQLVT